MKIAMDQPKMDVPQASRPALGVCYYPEHWPRDMWESDAVAMRDAGLSHVRIGEFAWSRLEPDPGQLDLDWMGDAIDVLAGAGLKVVLSTPTATPPKWLVDKMPDMLAVDADDRPRRFGSRRHYCFSHPGYREESARITRIVAEAFGSHLGVAAWQTDNEYGCHDTTLSYSKSAEAGFRRWLEDRYGTIEALNDAWGTVFWSMEYRSFNEVDLPNLAVTETAPAHRMDFHRYSSDQVVAFNRIQTDILRELSRGRPIMHNFMGRELAFDHFKVSEDLDIAAWDTYPLGHLERFAPKDSDRTTYARSGHPDFQAFHHDLYRACGRGRWWVMEQQPGPVNWAPWNPAPRDGMVRLWTLESIAHGAEVVSCFRWRQAPFAQEQLHAGLNLPDGTPDVGLGEAKQAAEDLASLDLTLPLERSPVAVLFDHEAMWASSVQPQGQDYDVFDLTFGFYRAMRERGVSIDVVAPGADFEGYRAIIMPSSIMADKALVERLKTSGAQVLIGPRSGSRDRTFRIPESLPPGPIANLIPMRITRVESLRPTMVIAVNGNQDYRFIKWREFVETTAEVVRTTEDGLPAQVREGRFQYLAGWPNDVLMAQVIDDLLDAANLTPLVLPEDVRCRDNGRYRFFVNYGTTEQDLSQVISGRLLLGASRIGPAEVTVEELVTPWSESG